MGAAFLSNKRKHCSEEISFYNLGKVRINILVINNSQFRYLTAQSVQYTRIHLIWVDKKIEIGWRHYDKCKESRARWNITASQVQEPYEMENVFR